MLISVFLIYVAWRIIRGLFLYPLGSWQVFGATTSVRLVSLGIAALISPKAVTSLFMLPVKFLMHLVDRLPYQVTRLVTSAASSSGATYSNFKEPVIRLTIMIQEVFSEVSLAFNRAIEGIAIPELVVALGIWAVMGNLLSATIVTSDGTQISYGESRLSRYIKALSAKQRYGIFLASVLMIGSYLSIAAIVAIPWLQEEKAAPGLNQANLEKMLGGILPSTSAPLEERQRNLPSLNEDPLAQLSEFISKNSSPANGNEYMWLVLNQAIADSKESRNKAITEFRQMPAKIMQHTEKMRQSALSAFEMETATPMSTQERSYFVREIQRSVISDYSEMENTLNTCSKALRDADNQLRVISQNTAAFLSTPAWNDILAGTGERDQTRAAFVREISKNLAVASQSMCTACETQIATHTFYTPPKPGIGWGPFGLVARWLLQTKSFALSLITGMLGFGLLGSAISTFVRAGAFKENHDKFSGNILSIVIRGLSAAVVVFLAVKGGLAIFSTGESEPNAYVVFFTCLVGSVFSEDVWNWARTKFIKKLNGEDNQRATNHTTAGANKQQEGEQSPASKKEGE
jgi:hypothetical protein